MNLDFGLGNSYCNSCIFSNKYVLIRNFRHVWQTCCYRGHRRSPSNANQGLILVRGKRVIVNSFRVSTYYLRIGPQDSFRRRIHVAEDRNNRRYRERLSRENYHIYRRRRRRHVRTNRDDHSICGSELTGID